MNETYNKEDLARHLKSLLPEGYSLNEDNWMVKEETPFGRIIHIIINYDEYFPDSVCFNGINVEIRYPDVETVIETLFSQGKSWNNNRDPWDSTFNKGFGSDFLGPIVYKELYSKEVRDDKSFASVSPILKSCINSAIQWLNQYQTLKQCYDYSESLGSNRDTANFYSGQMPIYKTIILKLIEDPNYLKYVNNLIISQTNQGRMDLVQYLEDIKLYLG